MRRYVYALAAATIMSAAMPVMAEETSTEEETLFFYQSDIIKK